VKEAFKGCLFLFLFFIPILYIHKTASVEFHEWL
jgi:hypothetical protein